MTTQPAGEQHTGTLDPAAGLGNPRSCSKRRAHNSHPWTDGEIDYDCGGKPETPTAPVVYYCPTSREIEQQRGGFDVCCRVPELHEPIPATVLIAIRQQVAEEIAAKCLRRAQLAERVPEGERSGVREGMVLTWLEAERLARDTGKGDS
jgi:hypothetical protein